MLHIKYSKLSFFIVDCSLKIYNENYSAALDHISMIKNEPFPVNADIYILKIKIFYELGFTDSALSVADSFRHFLSGSKLISDNFGQLHYNFLKYFNIIAKLKSNKNVKKMNKLHHDIKECRNIRDKNWLLSKTVEIIEDIEK